MAQAISARQDFDKGSKILNAAHNTVVDFANLNGGGRCFDPFQCLLGKVGIISSDRDTSCFINLDNRIKVFLDLADVFTSRPDQHANFLRINLACEKSGCVF